MNSGFLAYLSWREMLMALVLLLALYVLFTFLRISRLRSGTRPSERELSPDAIRSAVRSYTSVQESDRDEQEERHEREERDKRRERVPAKAARRVAPEPPAAAKKQAFAWNEPPDNPEPRRVEVLEQEIARLRREIGGLRTEVRTLREEQRREMSKVQITQNTSPFYSDAMQLAMQGREAEDISLLCGISRAEAELVVALARNKS
jgi:hypothetical protein